MFPAPLDILFISFLGYGTLPYTLVYIHFRNRMLKNKNITKKYFCRKEVMKLALINLSLLIICLTFLIWLYFSLLGRLEINNLPIFYFLSYVFLALLILIAYGSGIYLSAVVIEQFTMREIKRASDYKTQFLATYLFHGPISHIFVYSGGLLSFWLLYLIERSFSLPNLYSYPNWILFSGIFLAVSFSFGVIYNGTYKWQGALCLALYFLLMLETLLFAASPIRYPLGELLFSVTWIASLILVPYSLLEKKVPSLKRLEQILKAL